jgi:hypothetical protein
MIDEVNAFGSDVSFSAAFRFASCFDSPTPNIKMTVAELLQAGREARAEAMQWASRAKRENTRGNLVPTQDDHRITFQQAIEGVPELGLTPIPHATLRAWQRDPQVASDLGVNKDGKPQLQRFRVSVLLQLNENRQRKRTRQPQRGRPVSDQATPRKTRKNGKERELRS